MKVIYKYPLILKDRQQIKLPTSAKFLSLQVQNGMPVIWCMIDTDDLEVFLSVWNVSIYIFGTGNEVTCSDNCKFLGTVQLDSLVWHVFTPNNI